MIWATLFKIANHRLNFFFKNMTIATNVCKLYNKCYKFAAHLQQPSYLLKKISVGQVPTWIFYIPVVWSLFFSMFSYDFLKPFSKVGLWTWSSCQVYFSTWIFSFLIYLYIKMGVQMTVGMWRHNGNPNTCANLDEILHTHPHMSKECFGEGLTLPPHSSGQGGLKP